MSVMCLVGCFQQHAPHAVWARLGTLPELEATLGELMAKGRQRFPAVALSAEAFCRFLGRHLPDDIIDSKALSLLCGDELYLVCAYGQGDPAASKELEANYFPEVVAALHRINTPASALDELLQHLRHMLVEQQDFQSLRRGYSGRGTLGGWLRVVAVRKAGKYRRQEQRHQSLDASMYEILSGVAISGDQILLRETYKKAFAECFGRSLSTLSTRQRNLLRYHFLFHMNIDQIARIYGVHRVTAARWVSGAKEALVDRTNDEFRRHFEVSEESARHMLALIESQLSFSLGTWLLKETESEPGS